ncbi:MAG: hypothetical protein WAM82_32405 [Thermoanaerobaculia bacterium]
MKIETLIEELRASGWHVRLANERRPLPAEFLQRYPHLPPAVSDFLMTLEACFNPGETAWMLTAPDFLGTSDGAWQWNAFELMGLEFAGDDKEQRDKILAFWDKHFPVLLSVKTGYSYFAVSLEDNDFGSVVGGFEPLFEYCEHEATDFSAFLSRLNLAARGELDDSLLNAAV